MSTGRCLPWVLSVLLLVGASAQLAALATQEEVRETTDELGEELGEVTEEGAEGSVVGIAPRDTYDTWQVLVRDIATVTASGIDPLQDPELADRIRQSGDPTVFSAINNRVEDSAHAFRQGALVEVLPVTGAVFEAVANGGPAAGSAFHLKTGGSVLSGALFFLFGLRVIGRRQKIS